MGFNQGTQPIAGYNYAALKFDRMMRVLKYAIVVGTGVTTTGFLIGQFLAYPCVRLFTADPTLIAMSIHGMHITMITFPIIGYQMVIANFFQSIGKAKISVFLSLSRQLLFLMPLLLVLPPRFGVDGVWASMPVADTVSVIVAAVMMFIYIKKFKNQQKQWADGNAEINY